MKFSFQMVYDPKDFAALTRAQGLRRKPMRALVGLNRVCNLVCGGFLLLIGAVGLLGTAVSLLRGRGFYPPSLPIDAVFILLGAVLCFGRGGTLTAWLTWRRYPDKGRQVVYDFYDDHFEEHLEHSDHRFDYSVVLDVLESREHFLLFVNAAAAHVLRKTDMSGGEPAEFSVFLAEKCGKPPVHIR